MQKYISDSPAALALRLLGRYRTASTCRRLLEKRCAVEGRNLQPEVVESKAEGLASTISAALDYWTQGSASLNSRILTKYYAYLQFTMAEQVADVGTTDDLLQVQRHTLSGHGLFFEEMPDADGFHALNVGILASGHFSAYLKYLGVKKDMASYLFDRRPRQADERPPEKLVSLAQLLCRVPELQPLVREHLGIGPRAFHAHHAHRNSEERSKHRYASLVPGQRPPTRPAVEEEPFVWVRVMSGDPDTTADEIREQDLTPLRDPDEPTGSDIPKERPAVLYKLSAEPGPTWWDSLPSYRSAYSGTCIVSPAVGTRDVWLLNLMTLYGLSIVVRYRPDLWRRITVGDLSHLMALLEYYDLILDSNLPLVALDRITGERHAIVRPETLQSWI